MQKIINGIAIFSGAVALGIVGLGGYVYIRKDAIIEDVKIKIMESVLPGGLGDIGGGALGGSLDTRSLGAPQPAAPSRQAEPSLPTAPPLGF